MRAIRIPATLCAAAIFLGACGGSAPSGTSPGSTVIPGGGGQSAAPTGQTTAGELPMFMQDFDRVCETQVGFGGAATYDAATPGPHPVVLFYDSGDPPTLITASLTLPAGWTITEDMDFADNSELAAAQLIACSRRTAATPNGKMCDFTLNDGSTVTLELTDTVYEMTVYAASTGVQIGDARTLEASDTECPMFASFRAGDTRYLNTPTEDQYVNALREFVAP